ncbi:MAG: polyketide synthase dehydratase domain-containing protein [Pseudomonadota bacterium]
MENIPRPVETIAVPVVIPIPAYRRDHLVSGRAVLPAVEALQILARTLPASAGVNPFIQKRGSFSHLLTIDPRLCELPAVHEFSRYADGSCRSRLATVLVGRQSTWTRRVEHASVWFPPAAGEKEERVNGSAPIFDEAMAMEGPIFTFSSRRLYDELVPFGPSYQNVTGEVRLAPAGAVAHLSGGAFPDAVGPLGSPFPFDAALHAACAWGQRYRGTVAFPVGFHRREIHVPTEAGQTYLCAVVPLPEENPAVLRFDIGIYGEDHRPVEVIREVEMRDISGGRLKSPAWIQEGG